MFSRNVTAQSHLDLKVWSCHTLRNELLGTASVNLSNVLKNNGGKSMYDAGVADVIHLWVWGRDMKAGISLMWRINLGDAVSSRTRGCSDSAPCAWDPWRSREAEGYPLPLLWDSAPLVQGPSCWDISLLIFPQGYVCCPSAPAPVFIMCDV